MKDINKAINFIAVNRVFSELGIILVGYFPYHTARIESPSTKISDMTYSTSLTCIPRSLFIQLENTLARINVIDNKTVYIFKPMKSGIGSESFAIMFKDFYCLIGSWEQVCNYNNTKLTYYE